MSFLIRALVWIMAMVIFSGCGLPKRQSPVFNAMGYYPPRTVSIGKELGGLEKYFAPNAATSFPRDELVYGRKKAIDLIMLSIRRDCPGGRQCLMWVWTLPSWD